MYKAKYTNGDTWHEFIKTGPKRFTVLKINGDGSHTTHGDFTKLVDARETVRHHNESASESAKTKLAYMTEGVDFLSKKDFKEYSQRPEIDRPRT